MARRPAARAGWMAGCASLMRARCCEHVSKRLLRKQLEAVVRGARDQHGGAPCGRRRPARPRAPRRRRPPRAPRPARRTARPPARAQRGALTSPCMSLSCKSLRACVFHALIRHRRVRQRRTQRARQRSPAGMSTCMRSPSMATPTAVRAGGGCSPAKAAWLLDAPARRANPPRASARTLRPPARSCPGHAHSPSPLANVQAYPAGPRACEGHRAPRGRLGQRRPAL